MPSDKMRQNLSLLQEQLVRDPASYRDEFIEQYRHFESLLSLAEVQPQVKSERLLEIVFFLCHSAHFYKDVAQSFAQQLVDMISRSAQTVQPALRLGICKALLLLHGKRMLTLPDLVNTFLDLLKCRDKTLRRFLYTATISRVKRLNAKRRDPKVNSTLQAILMQRAKRSNAIVVRFCLLILTELFRRRIWFNENVANAIAEGCFNGTTKIAVASMMFMLGSDVTYNDVNMDNSEDDDDVEEENVAHNGKNNDNKLKALKEIMLTNRVCKKSKKRARLFEKAKAELQKRRAKQCKAARADHLNSAAILMLRDAQDFAERLYHCLVTGRDRFEVRLLRMALISRLIMTHRLLLLNFYPFLHRYLNPKQREITKILLFAAHASHDLVPPDVIAVMVRVIAQNFITDRNSSEAIAVGLNAIREVVANCPLAISDELMRDLAEYKKYKNKNVQVGARSLIHLFRRINPKALPKRDRGRRAAVAKDDDDDDDHHCRLAAPYGASDAVTCIQGADCLLFDHDNNNNTVDEKTAKSKLKNQPCDITDSESSHHSDSDNCDMENDDDTSEADEGALSAVKKAEIVSSSRILNDNDFEKIAASQALKQVLPSSKKKQLSDFQIESIDHKNRQTKLADIEFLVKKPKQDRQARKASAEAGREAARYGKQKSKGTHVGRNKKQLAKLKAFPMVKHKSALKRKNRSFRQQQQALRQYLIKQSKMY
ncbi:Protein SDA1 -like protein [Trichinella zimbabwensis]|uniref:Protein SDA1 n=1 Tax=Trichinella zimbabwensis TaxID=268475 RepID=A0A0V1HQY5_9BILA|nr:Protein SDA1 -like protein [Trichinella zimbabwensis]KRZ12613.1 Protein SDA1 -like protein [Trichinella zimbabwensis]